MAQLGVRTRLGGIRGMSKVVAAGITVPGETFDRLAEEILPSRLGGGPGDYQFVEDERGGATTVALRIHPRLGAVDEQAALDAVTGLLAETESGVLANAVWRPAGTLRVVRDVPAQTRAGKTLSYERVGRPAPSAPAEKVT